MTGIIIAAILIFLIVMFILCYNKLTKERITVDEAFSTMDVYLKKRFDLIPNLVERVMPNTRLKHCPRSLANEAMIMQE